MGRLVVSAAASPLFNNFLLVVSVSDDADGKPVTRTSIAAKLRRPKPTKLVASIVAGPEHPSGLRPGHYRWVVLAASGGCKVRHDCAAQFPAEEAGAKAFRLRPVRAVGCTGGNAELVSAADTDRKVVALTFDDGWGRRSTRMILRTLQDKRVNATFFPVGQAVRHDPDTWRRVAAAGFPIADHTYDHGKLKGMCYLAQRTELSRARGTFKNVLHIEALPVMRPPGGFFDDATLSAAGAVGEQTLVMWDVDTHDWTGIGTRQVRRNALAGTKGSIIVLHTSSVATARALPDIVRGYRKRGFEFVTIGQLLGIDGAVPYPPETEG